MLSVFDVANWFLAKESMYQKKLQKLCYYAQAWSWALNGKSLFNGKFEAWAHGPVSRELWDRFKLYGYVNIEQDACSVGAKTISASDVALLNAVWDTYGDLTGFQLEDLTHKEDPWIKARNGLPYYAPSTAVIDEAVMREYYKSQYSGDGIGE
jgi:uncharacterized phage-associated protein